MIFVIQLMVTTLMALLSKRNETAALSSGVGPCG